MEDRETYDQFLSTYSCPPAWPKEQRADCKNLLYHLNTHIDIETVAFNLTDAAIKRAFEKQGRPLPADLLVAGGGALPGWVLATFLANCMQDVSACSDPGRQGRHVKLLCACVALVLQRQPHALSESLPELLAFCIEEPAAPGL
ncbi:hypothetical protein ABPG75_003098 [Micractinium tetrahymenae]